MKWPARLAASQPRSAGQSNWTRQHVEVTSDQHLPHVWLQSLVSSVGLSIKQSGFSFAGLTVILEELTGLMYLLFLSHWIVGVGSPIATQCSVTGYPSNTVVFFGFTLNCGFTEIKGTQHYFFGTLYQRYTREPILVQHLEQDQDQFGVMPQNTDLLNMHETFTIKNSRWWTGSWIGQHYFVCNK